MSSSKVKGLDRKHSMPVHKYTHGRRSRTERQPSIKDINELYSALQDLVNLNPDRPTKLPGDENLDIPSEMAKDSPEIAAKTENHHLGRPRVSRAASSPNVSPRLRKKSSPAFAKVETEHYEDRVGRCYSAGASASPSLLQKSSKIAPGDDRGEDVNDEDDERVTKGDVASRKSRHPIRARSRSTPGISKAAAIKKIKERQRKITESFSKKEKVELPTPTVIRGIDDLLEFAKEASPQPKPSPNVGRRQPKKLATKRISDSFLTPDAVSSRLDSWYQKAVAKAVVSSDFEDTDDSSLVDTHSDITKTTRKASNVSLNSVASTSSLNSYNSGCTDFSTTEDNDIVGYECRRFAEQLKNLDIGDDEDFDSDDDSGVNVKPTIILVREKSHDMDGKFPKAISDSRLLQRFHGEGADSDDRENQGSIKTSTPEKVSGKPYFYIPNLTDDQKANFAVVVNYDDKGKSSGDETVRKTDKSKIGTSHDSNFYKLKDRPSDVIYRTLPAPKIRPKSYDVAEGAIEVEHMMTQEALRADSATRMSRTKSMYVGKEAEKRESDQNSKSDSLDRNENVLSFGLGISEKKWWEKFKPKALTEQSSGSTRKKTKRKSSIKRR